MTADLRDEFQDFFSDAGGVAEEDFIDTFKHGPLINVIRRLAQAEAADVSAGLAEKGVAHTVYFDLLASPELNALAATPRDGVSFIAINLGTVLRARILMEILLSQAHNPNEQVVPRELLLSLIRQNTDVEEQWDLLREMDQKNFILNAAFPDALVLIQWAFGFDYVFSHEMHHVMLGHTRYAEQNLRLDKLKEGLVVSDEDEQRKLQIIELRADYASGIMLGNRLPNKRTLIFPAPQIEKLMVEELMANAAFALTAMLSGFSIAWAQDPTSKLYSPGSHPHPDFRFRITSDGVMASLKQIGGQHADTWFKHGAYLGNGFCKRAYAKILGPTYEMDLQPGPVFYLPKQDRMGPHPHVFSTDAEVIYEKLFEAVRELDGETSVTAYLS